MTILNLLLTALVNGVLLPKSLLLILALFLSKKFITALYPFITTQCNIVIFIIFLALTDAPIFNRNYIIS
jgi:hypothetical protein